MKQSIESNNNQWTLVRVPRSPQLTTGIEALRQLHSDKQYLKGWEQAKELLKQFPDCTEILGFMILFAKAFDPKGLALGLALHHLHRYPHDNYLTYQLGMLYYAMLCSNLIKPSTLLSKHWTSIKITRWLAAI
jgi:hypothetical protein